MHTVVYIYICILRMRTGLSLSLSLRICQPAIVTHYSIVLASTARTFHAMGRIGFMRFLSQTHADSCMLLATHLSCTTVLMSDLHSIHTPHE